MLKTHTLFHIGMLVLASLASPAFAQTAASAVAHEPIKELVTTDTQVGTGEEAVVGKTVTVHYTGWLYSYAKPEHKGSQFDSSVKRGQPFSFPLGGGRVIKGWDQGVAGMKVGGKRTLIIPPELGYGARGAGRGAIPPNAPLVFEVELLGVR